MLDMGFKPAVSRIVGQTPAERQTLFFSATLEGATGKIAAAYTRDARRHTQAATERGEADIEHRFLHVDSQSAKLDHLVDQLRGDEGGRTLVFVRTKRGADRLVKRLRSRELEAVAMHGDKSQGQRERALARFERGEVDALIATDVAARGIDVADITHVINFDAPGGPRLLRAPGRPHRPRRAHRGTGISFVLADQADEMRRMAGDLGLVREFDGAEGKRGKQAASRAQRRSETTRAPPPQADEAKVSPATAAKRWTCDRCGVAVGQHRRHAGAAARELGAGAPRASSAWPAGVQRAAEEALDAAPDECSTDARAKARRAGLIEFEVRRTPDLADNTIARACRTSASAVAAARKRLDMGESPPPGADRDRATARRATASHG